MCSNNSTVAEIQQNAMTADLDPFSGHFSGAPNKMSTIKYTFKLLPRC